MPNDSFQKKVQDKIQNKQVSDYVKDLETQPQELKTNIPTSPFMVGDGSDGIETDELTTKQNMMFMDYLKRNRYKNFGEWWNVKGKEQVGEIYSETIMENDLGRDRDTWWIVWFRKNINSIIDRLMYCDVWGDSVK